MRTSAGSGRVQARFNLKAPIFDHLTARASRRSYAARGAAQVSICGPGGFPSTRNHGAVNGICLMLQTVALSQRQANLRIPRLERLAFGLFSVAKADNRAAALIDSHSFWIVVYR
jgi:hypothetical protein